MSRFDARADELLNHTALIATSIFATRDRQSETIAFRPVEVEFYEYSSDHPDPFAHRYPVQLEPCRWYFHRTGDAYRGGTYKGLDVTFGDGTKYGGVLFRSLLADDGTLTDGPSLCVDRLLATTGVPTVAEMDRIVGERRSDAPRSPLQMKRASDLGRRVFATPRVGLSLRRQRGPVAWDFLARPYRYLAEPKRVRKGREQLVVALHRAGLLTADIARLTGTGSLTVSAYAAAYDAGRKSADPTSFEGAAPSSVTLCTLLGACDATSGR